MLVSVGVYVLVLVNVGVAVLVDVFVSVRDGVYVLKRGIYASADEPTAFAIPVLILVRLALVNG